MFAVRFMLKN